MILTLQAAGIFSTTVEAILYGTIDSSGDTCREEKHKTKFN